MLSTYQTTLNIKKNSEDYPPKTDISLRPLESGIKLYSRGVYDYMLDNRQNSLTLEVIDTESHQVVAKQSIISNTNPEKSNSKEIPIKTHHYDMTVTEGSEEIESENMILGVRISKDTLLVVHAMVKDFRLRTESSPNEAILPEWANLSDQKNYACIKVASESLSSNPKPVQPRIIDYAFYQENKPSNISKGKLKCFVGVWLYSNTFNLYKVSTRHDLTPQNARLVPPIKDNENVILLRSISLNPILSRPLPVQKSDKGSQKLNKDKPDYQANKSDICIRRSVTYLGNTDHSAEHCFIVESQAYYKKSDHIAKLDNNYPVMIKFNKSVKKDHSRNDNKPYVYYSATLERSI